MGKDQKPRLNVNIPADLLDRFKEVATKQGRTMSDIINSMLQEFVKGGENQITLDELKKRVEALEKEVFNKK